jgi:hypothetical protein
LGGNVRAVLVAGSVTGRRRHSSKTHAKSAAERKRRRAAALKRYDESPKGRYKQHKRNAKLRGVEFLLTFEQWYELWEPYLDQRGNGEYVMARNGDTGPYAVGNVSIKPQSQNAAERNRWYFAARRWREPNDADYQHVHSAPDVDSSKFNGEPGPDVPF